MIVTSTILFIQGAQNQRCELTPMTNDIRVDIIAWFNKKRNSFALGVGHDTPVANMNILVSIFCKNKFNLFILVYFSCRIMIWN